MRKHLVIRHEGLTANVVSKHFFPWFALRKATRLNAKEKDHNVHYYYTIGLTR